MSCYEVGALGSLLDPIAWGRMDSREGEGLAPAPLAAVMSFVTQSHPGLAGEGGLRCQGGAPEAGRFPSMLSPPLATGAASPAPGNGFPQIGQRLGAGMCLQGGDVWHPLHSPRSW